MSSHDSRAFLDRPAARLAAIGIFALCAAALIYIHRDDLFPSAEPTPVAADDPFQRCYAEATAKIDRMKSGGTINGEQAKLFGMRAEARCRAQTDGGAPPKRPGLPPNR
jgi:hypothetical protein